MTFPIPHGLVTVSGPGLHPAERWSFGFRVVPDVVGTQATADALAPYVQAMFVDPNMAINSDLKLDSVKVAHIEEDGHYPPLGISGEHIFAPSIPGASVAAQRTYTLPQASICVSLTTAMPRGLGSKGRFYLPTQVVAHEADYQLDPGFCTAVGNTIRTMILAINADPLIGNVAIVSRGKGVPRVVGGKKIVYDYPTAGTYNLVTGVKVGRVQDTQRRRRRAMPEDPIAVAL